jgi:hypothetical protein
VQKGYKSKIIEHNLADGAEFIKEEETYRNTYQKRVRALWNTDCSFQN